MTQIQVRHATIYHYRTPVSLKLHRLLLILPLATATMRLAVGISADSPGRPPGWAKLIAESEYRQGATLL